MNDMNITLIGMPGVGKSTLGKELAKKLDYQFVDIDEVTEKKLNLKLPEIINQFGESTFLKTQEQITLELGKLGNSVISTGGSAVYSIKAMNFLKKKSVIIFLKASLESIKTRIPDQSKRGIIGLKKKNLEVIFQERIPLYKKYANITIEMSDDFNVNTAIKDIIQKIFNK